MRTLAEWLTDIRNAITNLEEAKDYGRERFDNDKYVQVWMIYHIAIIGEAALLNPMYKRNILMLIGQR